MKTWSFLPLDEGLITCDFSGKQRIFIDSLPEIHSTKAASALTKEHLVSAGQIKKHECIYERHWGAKKGRTDRRAYTGCAKEKISSSP